MAGGDAVVSVIAAIDLAAVATVVVGGDIAVVMYSYCCR